MQSDFVDIINLFHASLPRGEKIPQAIDFFLQNSQIVVRYAKDLDMGVALYNSLSENSKLLSRKDLLMNTFQLREIAPDFVFATSNEVLRQVQVLSKNNEFLEKYFADFDRMDSIGFFDTMEPVEDLAGTLFVGAYRTFLRIQFPELVEKGVQFASVIEEMLAVMALDGEITELFKTIVCWFVDYEADDFSEEMRKVLKKFLNDTQSQR